MPKVPVSRITQSPTSLPDSRISLNINPDPAASISRGLTTIADSMHKMQLEDDANAATEVFNKASEDARKYLYEGDDAIYSRQGKNASGAHDVTKKFFEDTSLKYSTELKNANQQKAFKAMWDRRTNTNLDNVARHEAAQRKQYLKDTQDASLAGAAANAANNYDKPDEIANSLTEIDTIIRANAPGDSEEVVLNKQAIARSTVHKSVIDRMMINDPDGAKAYYDLHKDSVEGKDHAAIEKNLQGNLQKRRAQDQADKIMASDLTDAQKRKLAKEEDNPETRALIEGLVNQDIAQRKTDEAELDKQMSEAFWTEFIANPDINNIPQELPSATKLAAIKFATSGSRKTDMKVWNDINQMTVNDPDKFIKMDLYKYVNSLDESDFQAFGKLQRTLGTDKLALTHVQTVNSKATKALGNIGKKVDSDSGQLFMRKFQDEVSAFEVNENRKINPDEVDKIIDRLMIEGEVKGTVYDPDKRLFEVDPAETFFIEDVPKAEREKIIDAYSRKGITPTEEQIIQTYTIKKTR